MDNLFSLPLEVIKHSWAETSIVDASGNRIALLSIAYEATEETEEALEKQMDERAALIVTAVNSHAALVEALSGLLANYKRNEGRGLGIGPIQKAKAALKLAGVTP